MLLSHWNTNSKVFTMLTSRKKSQPLRPSSYTVLITESVIKLLAKYPISKG